MLNRLNSKVSFESRFLSKRNVLAILAPLEEAVSKNKPSSQHHHVDNERERTYSLAGSVDAQIKLLAQDLKEVIVYSTYGQVLR